MAVDYSDGALTRAQLTSRVQKVREEAQGVAHQDVQTITNAMVRAVLAGDDKALSEAVTAMDFACKMHHV